jgi:hypothetical protein
MRLDALGGAPVLTPVARCPCFRPAIVVVTSTEHVRSAEGAEGFETFTLSVPLRPLRHI